jgi:hypothetical protein
MKKKFIYLTRINFHIFWSMAQCLSPLMLWVRISIRARCTTWCDKVCQWLATGLWFPPVSSTNKTDHHDIAEILLKAIPYFVVPTWTVLIYVHKHPYANAQQIFHTHIYIYIYSMRLALLLFWYFFKTENQSVYLFLLKVALNTITLTPFKWSIKGQRLNDLLSWMHSQHRKKINKRFDFLF